MKITRAGLFRLMLIILLAVGIAIAVLQFMVDNRDRITTENEEYVTELTIQAAKNLDNLFAANLGFIRTTAYLYGESLTSPWADVSVIRSYEENSVFEYLRFVDASGDDYTSRGVQADLSDRDYFKSGMKGEAGITFVAESRVTGERQIGFYAPVYYDEDVIGIMVGFYGEEYIRNILDYRLFGFDGEGWICTPDGTVIGSTRAAAPENYLTCLKEEKKCTDEELARLKKALSGDEKVSFSYLNEDSGMLAYCQSLTQMPWILIMDFPASATRKLLDSANESGRTLITTLLILFLIFGILFAVGLIVELAKNKKTIRSTERDELTGLYNRQYFYHYVDEFDQHHKNAEMDAVLIDADRFQMVNERYGRAHGDAVLKCIAERLQDFIQNKNGVLCRRESDIFMMYCPHREDYTALLETASVKISEREEDDNRVRLRIGVYPFADKDIEAVRRFDKAKSAADTIRHSYHKQIAYYDDVLHRKELFEDKLISDFSEAIRNEQFLVYLQPKFDVRGERPVPSGAEALVRWEHPQLGLLGPMEFIPLFEKNGLIQELDMYVWRHAARILSGWKTRFARTLPISVNVSRVDMYDGNLPETLASLLGEFGLTTGEFLLEITESAYMDDSARITETARHLRSRGFRIEMDDFGTGYSSLSMINTLPIDVLKLDMTFVRAAFRRGRDTRMLEIILDIARYLEAPVIAEGVETREQLETLRQMGCDYVQGYYFSRPVPADEFEKFLSETG